MADKEPPEPPELPTELVEFGGEQRPPGRLSAAVDRLAGSMTSRRATAIGAAVVLAAVVASTVVMTSGGEADDDVAEPPPVSPAPVRFSPGAAEPRGPAPETTWVAYRGVMLAVPATWVQTDVVGCGTAPAGAVAYPGSAPSRCPASAARDGSTVTFHDGADGIGRLRADADPVGRIGGRPVLATAMERTESGYLSYVVVPAADLYVVVTGSCDETTQRIVASVRQQPAGRVRMPDLRGLPPRQALRRIEAAGLEALVQHNSGEALPRRTEVVDQNPVAGVVVRRGAEVSIAVRPAR